MDFFEYIKAELLALVPALYFLAHIMKNSFNMVASKIPLMLGITGVILAALYVFATTTIVGYQDVLTAIFTSIVQGFLCAGGAVYANQLYKQQIKTIEKEVK